METTHYRIELLSDEPILLFETYPEYTLSGDWRQVDIETRQFLDQSSEPLFYLIDITKASLSLEDIVLAANIGARGPNTEAMNQEIPLWKHPNIQEMVFVTTRPILTLAAKGLDSLAFGNIKTKTFATQEEALGYIRARVAES